MPPIDFKAIENDNPDTTYVYLQERQLYIGYIADDGKTVDYHEASSPVVDIGQTTDTLTDRLKSKRGSHRDRLQRFWEAKRFEASRIEYRFITTDAICLGNDTESDGVTIIDPENALQWYFIFGARALPLANQLTGTSSKRKKARYYEVRKLADLHVNGGLKWENIFPRADGRFLGRLEKAASEIQKYPQASLRSGLDGIPADCHIDIQGFHQWYCHTNEGDTSSLGEWRFARAQCQDAKCEVDKGKEPLKKLTDWLTDQL